MNLTRAQQIRLGTFMASGLLLLVATLALLTGLRLWEPRSLYQARFKDSVSGLEENAPVKYQGLRVGRVEAMRIAPDDPGAIEVDLSVLPSTVLYEGTVCALDIGGLTGLKSINITAGDRRRPVIKPGSMLPTGASLFDRITDNAAVIVGDVKRVADQLAQWMNHDNRLRLESLLRNLDKFVGHLDTVMMESSTPIRGLIGQVGHTTVAIGEAAHTAQQTLKRAQGSADRLEQEAVATLQALRRPLQNIDPQDVAQTLVAMSQRGTVKRQPLPKAKVAGLPDAPPVVSPMTVT